VQRWNFAASVLKKTALLHSEKPPPGISFENTFLVCDAAEKIAEPYEVLQQSGAPLLEFALLAYITISLKCLR